MTYAIKLTRAARRALEIELPEQVAAAIYEFVAGPLASNPHRVGKPLMGEFEGSWSARRGDYRVIYDIDKHVVTVTVIRIGHRGSVYH